MKVIVVGFKVAEENQVYYKKLKRPGLDAEAAAYEAKSEHRFRDADEIGKAMLAALGKGAEFVSVRFIKEAGE